MDYMLPTAFSFPLSLDVARNSLERSLRAAAFPSDRRIVLSLHVAMCVPLSERLMTVTLTVTHLKKPAKMAQPCGSQAMI